MKKNSAPTHCPNCQSLYQTKQKRQNMHCKACGLWTDAAERQTELARIKHNNLMSKDEFEQQLRTSIHAMKTKIRI